MDNIRQLKRGLTEYDEIKKEVAELSQEKNMLASRAIIGMYTAYEDYLQRNAVEDVIEKNMRLRNDKSQRETICEIVFDNTVAIIEQFNKVANVKYYFAINANEARPSYYVLCDTKEQAIIQYISVKNNAKDFAEAAMKLLNLL